MEYQITLISHTTEIRPRLEGIYGLPEAPAGGFSLLEIGGMSVVTLHREAADDSAVLKAYGEELNQSTALRQLRLELRHVLGQLDADTVGHNPLITFTKEIINGLARGDVAVQGLTKAPDVHYVQTSQGVIGEDGSRCYAAVGTAGTLQLVRANELEQVLPRIQQAWELPELPDLDVYLVGHLATT